MRELPCGGFVRVNRSAIANLRFIKGYEGNMLKLPPHFSLPIGKNSREVCPLETGKMNKSKRSLKDFVWKGDCFGKKWLYLQKTLSYWNGTMEKLTLRPNIFTRTASTPE